MLLSSGCGISPRSSHFAAFSPYGRCSPELWRASGGTLRSRGGDPLHRRSAGGKNWQMRGIGLTGVPSRGRASGYGGGWLSDRMDRRLLILAVAGLGGAASILGVAMGLNYWVLLTAAFIVGGTTNPLYSLLIAHTNDFLEHEDMAAASGGLVFINGLGAIAGPLITGWLMGDNIFGAAGYFLLMAVLLVALAMYAAYRMTRRPPIPVEDTGAMPTMYPTATPVAVEFAQEAAIDAEQNEQL